MTKEEILNGMSEEEFYKLYPTEEAYFMAKGGSLSGAPHNGQPTADEFFSYGAPALGHMNIPMSNPTYLAHGGTYFGGPIRPYQEGGDTRTVSQMWKEVTGLPWSEAKKNGITDGSYEANMQLRNALLKGSFTNLSDIGQAPRFRASKQEPQQEEQINPIAAGRTAANIMNAPTPQSLLVSKKPSSKVKATQVDKAITKTTKKAPPAKHIDAGAFQVVDNITGVTADYFKNSPLPGVVNTPNVNTPGPFLQKAKMEQVHMFPKTKAGTPSQLKKGPTDKRKIPQSGLVVDKRTNQAYYFGDKGEKGSFPVLTGANPDLNYNIYTEAELDKNPELRNTPTGYYNLFPQSDVYGEKGFANLPIPAYGVPAPAAKELYTHVTYDPKNRGKLYKRSADNRAVTWGCTNCEKPNINTLTSVFPKGDTALVLDSKRAADLALLQQAQARLNQKRYGGLPMAQDGYYNLTPEEAEYLKNYPFSKGQDYYVGDDTHDLHFTIGLNNTISDLQKRNPKWKVEKTTKYVNIPLEGEDYEFAKKHLENDIKDKYQQSLVEKLNRDVTSYTPSDSFKQYINTLNERKKKGETLDGYDNIYHYMIDNTQGKPLSKHMLENYQGYHPAALAKYLQKEYFDKKYGGGLYKQSYGGDITEYCWGGGLPGGANEMKRMDYGGYMDMGGYNSPTNYGSFSVPMNEGGYYQPGGNVGLVGWAGTEQQKLEQRLQTGIPSDVKKYYGPYKEPRKFDSTHVFPGDPNIAIGFKGNKVMLISKDEDADNIVRKVNKDRTYVGPTIKGERDIYFDYLHPHEYGGALDASNNQDYPMMEEGGRANLMKIIKAASKKMKKEYATGGKVTMQGGNQNQLDNMNNYFKSFIQQNASNAFVEEEEKSFRMGGIPMAAGGWELSPEYRNSEKRSQVIKALENKKKIAINQNLSDDQLLDMARKEGIIVDTPDNQSQNTAQNTPSIASMFKQLAQDFGPQSRTQGYSNFPANFRSYWQANKAGRESINSLPDNFQLGNLKVSPEYDLLGRTWIGKKLGWGPKRINFELSGTSQYKNTPYKQGPQVQLADPNNPLFKPYSQYNTGAPEGTLQTNKGSFAPLDFHIGKQQGPMAYGGLYKAQPGVSTPISMGQGVALKGTAPGGTSLDSLYSLPVASSISTPANVEQMKKQAGRETEQLYKTEMQGDTGTTNVSAKGAFERDNSGLLEAVGQYAVPGLNMLSKAIEAPGQKKREQQAKLEAMTPGSDTGPFAVNPGNVLNTGDYDQWGNFRPNSKVAGPMYGEYGGMFEQGGFYEEGEEYDLSPEQMEYLRNQGYDFDILEDID